nr:MAG TPA: Head Tail Connector Protein [Caudoviricetes sp.]
MAYADYEFYTTSYFGDTVPESDFPRYAERASDRIDILTFDRLADGLPESERAQKKIKKAVCELADVLFQIDTVKRAAMETVGTVKKEDGTVINKAVSSISSGSESISYVTGTIGTNSSVYGQAAMDKKVENVLVTQIIFENLQGVMTDDDVPVLYAGVRL